MTIKIIDLLIKIANGEEVPKKVKYDEMIFEYQGSDWLCKKNGWWFITSDDKILENLNDEVEIIVDEEDKKIEKLTFNDTDVCCVDGLMKQSLNIKNTINKIIDRLNEMEKGE